MTRHTITDVAEAAGVSVATVSKALNGGGRISPATVARVQLEASRLGYVSRSKRSESHSQAELAYTVGVLTSDSFGRFTIPIMLGAEDALDPGRVGVLMCDSREDQLRERFYVQSLIRRRVDGIIVTGRSNDPRPPIGNTGRIPVVYAYAPSTDPRDCSVVSDNEEAGAIAVRHLIASGRSRLVHITGPETQAATRLRARGARAALMAQGRDWVLPVQHGEWSERWGRDTAVRLVRDKAPFDGAYCASDQIARGFVTGLRESGVAVPSEVGVIGTDNWDVMVDAARPPLTTIDLNQKLLGRRAAEIIIDAMQGRPTPSGLTTIPPTLVLRESSAAQL